MERIKAAIEKAKQQGLGEQKQATDTPNRSAPPVVVAPPPVQGALEVAYTETKVVSLDAAHLERNRIVAFNKTHPSNQAFDVLRTQVLQKMDEHGWRTVAVTSPNKEAGKTSVAINLAASIAHHTQRTAMLVDFDLRRPRVAQYLGIHPQPSLNDVLEGRCEMPEALVNPGLPRLVVLPANEAVARPAEVLSSARVSSMVQELRERYEDRVVIFDLPPSFAADDVMTILPKMDCVLLVLANGTASKKEIEEAMRCMPGTPLLGVVLNKDDSPQRRPYSYY